MNNSSRFSSKYKNILKVAQSQALKLKDCIPLPEIRENPVEFLQYKLTKKRRGILNFLIEGSERHKVMFYAQETIGDAVGLKRGSVCDALGYLEECGLVTSLTRYNKTKIYKISNWFKSPTVRQRIQHLFTGIFILPLWLIFSGSAQNNSTVVKKDIYISNQSSICNDQKPFLPSGIKETRVEAVQSWNPDGAMEITTNDKIFRDARYKSYSKDDESQAYQKRQEVKVGSTKSELNFRREQQSYDDRIQRDREARAHRLSWIMSDNQKQLMMEYGDMVARESKDPAKVYPLMEIVKKLGQQAFDRANKKEEFKLSREEILAKMTPDEIRTEMRKLRPSEQDKLIKEITEARSKYA